MAEQTITTASKQGNWVLLKNVHLAPQWLKELEKKLHSIKPHDSFRLFLSTEIHPKVPIDCSVSALYSDDFRCALVTNQFAPYGSLLGL